MDAGKAKQPISIEKNAVQRRRRSFALRLAAAAGLLLLTLGAKALFPDAAAQLRKVVCGSSTLDDAVSAFYDSVSGGSDMADAVSAFCRTLDESAS